MQEIKQILLVEEKKNRRHLFISKNCNKSSFMYKQMFLENSSGIYLNENIS